MTHVTHDSFMTIASAYLCNYVVQIHILHIITDADGSRVSIAIIRIYDSVCLSAR